MVRSVRTGSVSDGLSVYDAAGLRVAEKVNDVWRFLIYDIGGKCIAEYGGPPATDEGGVKYPLKDWQGSTRGSISNTGNVQSRQDFTAFGEEIGAGTGLRTSGQGFGASDSLREKYGLTERDDATGLDHTWFRKHENQTGRWTSPDPYLGSMSLGSSQSFNRYSYVESQPTNFVDPSGLNMSPAGSSGYCIRYHYSNGTVGYWGPWTCYPGSEEGGGGGGDPAPLNAKETKKLNKAITKINKLINKKKCMDFLKKSLGDDIIGKISSGLIGHQAFSGPRSTNLTTVEAGILSASEAIRLRNLVEDGGSVSAAADYELNRSVAQYFADNNGQGGRTVGAAVGNYGGNSNTAFYRSFSASSVFHENLHIASGLGDIDLATKLGVDPNSFGGDARLAGSKINDRLKEMGCK